MNRTEISNLRLHNQQLVQPDFNEPDKLVEWMGAIQAQDLPMAMLAIALRTNSTTIKTVETAFNEGRLIRTHLMRPTWHIISHRDIYWMLELTAEQVKRRIARRHFDLALDKDTLSKANRLLEQYLSSEELSRGQIKRIFAEHNIRTDENRLSHLLMNAELEQIICSGCIDGRLQTHALLSRKVPQKIHLSKEEALLKLGRTFFRSHGPATETDWNWWSGLATRDVRRTMEDLKTEMQMVSYLGETFYFYEEASTSQGNTGTRLLSAYDEFLISYQSKYISIEPKHRTKAAAMNGIFKPIIVVNGEIVGTWQQKSTSKEKRTFETKFFKDKKPDVRAAISKVESLFG